MIKIMCDDRENECYIEIDADSVDQAVSEAFEVFNTLVQEMGTVLGREVTDCFLMTLHNMGHAGVLGLLTLTGGDGANAGG